MKINVNKFTNGIKLNVCKMEIVVDNQGEGRYVGFQRNRSAGMGL